LTYLVDAGFILVALSRFQSVEQSMSLHCVWLRQITAYPAFSFLEMDDVQTRHRFQIAQPVLQAKGLPNPLFITCRDWTVLLIRFPIFIKTPEKKIAGTQTIALNFRWY
jgi:hypothetical protein